MTPAGHANAMCTILAKNYIAHARTLIRSFQALHPECACYALIVDDHNAFLNPHEEGFDILALSDLDIVNVPSFCFKYNLTELCTAAKPYLLNHLIQQRGVKKLLYLDPDIMPSRTSHRNLTRAATSGTPSFKRAPPGISPDSVPRISGTSWIACSGTRTSRSIR